MGYATRFTIWKLYLLSTLYLRVSRGSQNQRYRTGLAYSAGTIYFLNSNNLLYFQTLTGYYLYILFETFVST